MKHIVLRYSLIAVAILVILGIINWLLIARPFGYTAAEIIGYLSMILSLSMIYFAIRRYRADFGHGVVSFNTGFQIGIMITLLTSALFFLYSVIYFRIWGADFKEYALEHYQSSLTSAQYEAYTRQMEQMGGLYENIWFQGAVMFLTVFFIGLIITLISALALRRP